MAVLRTFLLSSIVASLASPQPTPAPPPAKPYHYSSLSAFSDEQLFRYMGRGKTTYDFESTLIIRNHLPPSFWTDDPKSAALALVKTNRKEEHRAEFQIAVQDGDKIQPPPRCNIALSALSPRCYNAVDAYYFLHVDPEDSYLAYARRSAAGVVFYNVAQDQPAFDLRLCHLRYDDAKQASDVIWWLNRVRSRSANEIDVGEERTFSTADGKAKLIFRADTGETSIERAESIWADHIAERWSGDYHDAAFINFSAYVITGTLKERLGREWSQYEPGHFHDVEAPDQPPRYNEQEVQRLKKFALRFLNWFGNDQQKISYAITAGSAEAVGEFGIAEAKPVLETIRKNLPPNEPPKRKYHDVYTEKDRLLAKLSKVTKSRKKLQERIDELDRELDTLADDYPGDSVTNLRDAVTLALRKIAAADNADELYRWATEKQDGAQWALRRLARVDQQRYTSALVHWMGRLDPKWSRQLFAELEKTDPARAIEVAKAIPPQKKDALTVSAFSLLSRIDKISDEGQRINAIIKTMHDPKVGWHERGSAIELLVPKDAPLRYPSRKVDGALLRLLEPDQADDLINFTAAEACRALARRGRVELFDRIANMLDRTTDDRHVYQKVLGALVHLAQKDPARFNPRILAIVRPHLTRTNVLMTEILWAIWAADLRELKPQLEQEATSGPDDYEDRKAYSEGGPVTQVEGQFHMARKIASLWNESDAFTRLRCLIAFAVVEKYFFVGEPIPERVARLQLELAKAAKELSATQRQQIGDLLNRVDQLMTSEEYCDPDLTEKLVVFLRQELHI